MKKLYLSLVFMMFFLSFSIGIFIYSLFSTAYSISDRKSDTTVVNIHISDEQKKQDITVVTKKLFYSQIKNAANETNVNIYKITYPVCTQKDKKKVVVYAYINNEKDFYKNIICESGRLLNKNDTGKTYISSENMDDINCVGKIKWFDKSVALEIRPIDSNQNDLIYGKYLINTRNVQKFNNALQKQKVVLVANELSFSKFLNVLDENGLKNFYLISLISILSLGIIFISILISCSYMLVYRYKNFAVKKLFGSGNFKLILKFWLELIIDYLFVALFSYAALILFLYFYNRWAQIKTFLLIISAAELIVFVIFSTLLFILTLLINFINIKLMIKNKKPLFVLSLINNVTKIIFCTVIFFLGILLSSNLIKIKNQIHNLKRWDFTKNYAFATFDLCAPENSTEKQHWEAVDKFELKTYKLHQLMKENNNLLMRPTDALISSESKIYYEQNHRKPWSPEMNSIDINNNYLKQNPIYDENGKRVDLTDYENKYVMIILVPEKYKPVENEIIASYQEHCDFRSEFTAQKLSLKLIYVKNNQKYFSMNPLLAAEKNFEFVDPIAIVINNCSIAPDTASAYMTQGYYYFYIDNPNNPYESMNETIKKLDMENNFITISSLYNFVGETIYSTMQLMNIYLILVGICTVPFFVSIFAIVANYIDRKKQILSIKYMNGYSFFKLHYKIFLKTILTWIIIFCIMTFIFCSLDLFSLNFSIIFVIGFVLSLIDLLLEYFILKTMSLKKVKDLIKGV